jgi:hypothetical protein
LKGISGGRLRLDLDGFEPSKPRERADIFLNSRGVGWFTDAQGELGSDGPGCDMPQSREA